MEAELRSMRRPSGESRLIMSFFSLIAGTCLALTCVSALAAQENFESVLRRIQNTHWKGQFRVNAFGGAIDCRGPLDVASFPMQIENFSNGVPTVSYRHHADFSQTPPGFCRDLAGSLSPVAVGQCGPNFPMKYSQREGKRVPFRTIIPRDGGRTAVVSSPSCDPSLNVTRQELNLARLELSDHDKTLQVTIEFEVPLLGEIAELTYVLHRK
jgi:hypothetical protein